MRTNSQSPLCAGTRSGGAAYLLEISPRGEGVGPRVKETDA